MKGYVEVPQWYGKCETWEELTGAPDGDAASYAALCGTPRFTMRDEQPRCSIGRVVFRVEDDNTLTRVAANYDSSG